MPVLREKQLLQNSRLPCSFLPYVTLFSCSVFVFFSLCFPCCHTPSHLWPEKQVLKTINLQALLQRSKGLYSGLWHPTAGWNPSVFLSYPLPATVAHSIEPEKSLPEVTCLPSSNFFFAGGGHTAVWQFAEQNVPNRDLKLLFYQVLCSPVGWGGTCTERKKTQIDQPFSACTLFCCK